MMPDCSVDCALAACNYEVGLSRKLRESPVLKHIAASSLGSFVTILSLNPLSVIKVRIQSSKVSMSVSNITASIYRSEGILGFWSGARMGLIQALPNTVLYMTFYEYIKSKLSSIQEGPGIAGGLARCVSVTVVAPMEIVRTIQTGGSQESVYTISQKIYQSEGIKGFYRGWRSSILRDAPFSAIYWFSFESLKNRFTTQFHLSNTHMITFIAGACSGIIAALATHPFDVLKTQQQLSSANKVHVVGATDTYIVNGIIDLIRQEGYYALYKGLTMRLITVIPSSAIMVTVYEAVKALESIQ